MITLTLKNNNRNGHSSGCPSHIKITGRNTKT
nr:MAG TPA: hypothetical protein [Caudoviricetes sp.]